MKRRFWLDKTFLIAAAAAGVMFGAIQLVRPEFQNPPVTAEIQAPADVKRILKTSCYNCHSNETEFSWYDRIVPAYWIAVLDVEAGRKSLNFSDFGRLSSAEQRAKLLKSVNEIRKGTMPLASYRRIHPESAVSPADLTSIEMYLKACCRP